MTNPPVLYLLVAICPHCDSETKFVAECDQPVDKTQDITPPAEGCPHCMGPVHRNAGEWDVQEETRIERAPPVDEVPA